MREIKFRADDGMDWVYSSAVEYREEDDQWLIYDFELEEWLYCGKPQQYTGLKDNNSKRIYEGDILKRVVTIVVYGTGIPPEDIEETVEVKWREDYAGFYVGERPLFAEIDTKYDFYTSCRCTKFQVVGNTYDNPEMLAGD